jgi:hypothetical protein
MKQINLAILSPNHNDVVGILTVYANDVKDALKRVRQDPDMDGVRCHPISQAVEVAPVEPSLVSAVASLEIA